MLEDHFSVWFALICEAGGFLYIFFNIHLAGSKVRGLPGITTSQSQFEESEAPALPAHNLWVSCSCSPSHTTKRQASVERHS